MQKQNLVILGSTGSIGHSTLSVIEHNPNKYHAFALVGGKNVETMFEQCVKFQPHFAALDDENAAKVVAKLDELKGCEAHSSVILSSEDQRTLAKLGINLTCEPKYQTKKLFHN